MSTSTEMTITQTVPGGRFVDTTDREITLSTTDEHLGDYGDNAPRAVLDIPAGTTLRGCDLDVLIRNLETIRRVLP